MKLFAILAVLTSLYFLSYSVIKTGKQAISKYQTQQTKDFAQITKGL